MPLNNCVVKGELSTTFIFNYLFIYLEGIGKGKSFQALF